MKTLDTNWDGVERRYNRKTAALISFAISMRSVFEPDRAVFFLRQSGIEDEIIDRVLRQPPTQRRPWVPRGER